MSRRRQPSVPARDRGFTLVEILITLVVLALVVVALARVMFDTQRSHRATQNRLESVQGGRGALEMLARDLRNAGYGADLEYAASPQPPIAYIDSMEVIICADRNEPASVPGLGSTAPSAYDPQGDPKPWPLNGTAWTPPIKYRSQAELIRWTLDVNNDGSVDADDVASTLGADAQRTRNPSDFVLVREVYGDSAYKAVAGDNTGLREAIALVRRPASGPTPPLFRVYLQDSATPWDWSLGPLPPSQLSRIERVAVELVSPSPKPDWRGRYSEVVLRTEVFATRNVPDFGTQLHNVYGYVFRDLDADLNFDAGEPGLAGATVKCGPYTTVSAANGYYLFQVPSGTYTLQHWPPAGYMSLSPPSAITVPPATSRNFADVPKPGGTVIAKVFTDLDKNGVRDTDEPWRSGVRVEVLPGPDVKHTSASGEARLFAGVGAYTVQITPPDSFVVTGSNPQAGSIADGDSVVHWFGLTVGNTGTIAGRVFRDDNRNGVQDAGEAAFQNVWVGVATGTGDVVGYDYTNASGDYEIEVLANNPPGTNPYAVRVLVPSGFFPTTTTAHGPLLLGEGEHIAGQNFGVAGFQVITLNASRVLSLASANLIEKDWSGLDADWETLGVGDADLILGADQSGTDNVSVWFNQYDASSLFNANPTYTRNAAQSVLALAVDTLDSQAPGARPDLVTGTRNSLGGNFFFWKNQNSSGNLGFAGSSPTGAYWTADGGDVQSVLTLDCAGGPYPDLIVGTRSPTAGRGTFEVWLNNEGSTPTFTREEIYPPSGLIPLGLMGEVRAMALADIDRDGRKDLIVGTSTKNYGGQLLLFRNVSHTPGNRFLLQATIVLASESVTALATGDFDEDGYVDIVVGTQSGTASGRLIQYRHSGVGFLYGEKRAVSAPGIVQAVATADLGGTSRRDVVVGWRQDGSSFAGGVQVYYMDNGDLPLAGSDPSGGAVVHMVPALTLNNFNFGVRPTTPSPPYLTDVAAGVKITNSTGALVVLVR